MSLGEAEQRGPPPYVLLVDDDATLRKLGTLRLRDAGFEVETAAGADEALAKARRRVPDVVLSDVLMGDLDGFALCQMIRGDVALSQVPVILVSSHYRDELDQQLAQRVGASALVSRTPDFDAELAAVEHSLQVRLLPRSRAVDAATFEQHLRSNAHQLTKLLDQARSADERYRTLFACANDAIAVLTPDGLILEVNERWLEMLGAPADALVGRPISQLAPVGRDQACTEAFLRTVAQGAGRDSFAMQRADGRVIEVELSNRLIELSGRPLVLAIGHDVTADRAAAARLAAAEAAYRSLVERIPDVIWTADANGSITFVTPNAERQLGLTVEEWRGATIAELTRRVHDDDRERVLQGYARFAAGADPFDEECRWQHSDGRWLWIRNRVMAVHERDGVRFVDGMITDVTERRMLEESLRQAQKMEAIGQLTGGIAHDFNNLIAGVLAYSGFLLDDLAEYDPRRADAAEIKAAAERAAALTRQLLAFSRRQVLAPTVADLNQTVTGLERLLRRLIGEDLELSVNCGAQLGTVQVDVGQIEQVIMNLVVNARDAMPTGGWLGIETSNVELDELAARQVSAPPGHYVVLSVTDTGTGMSAETQHRIFEPFFTTKEAGRGTGLGLSTCYGIVKQSGGFISVYSEVGRGSVFKVYLPRTDALPGPTPRRPSAIDLSGTETILVVEDDDRVRAAVGRMLEPHGYRVLCARDGAEALILSESHVGPIHLVLSDMVMPGASGPEVVQAVGERAGGTRALYMSGYTDHAILRSGMIEPATHFIQKPFSPETLVRKVREVLDGGG